MLSALKAGQLFPELLALQTLLIDQYHDTDPMQEAICFELLNDQGLANFNAAFAIADRSPCRTTPDVGADRPLVVTPIDP